MKCPVCGEDFFHTCERSRECEAGECPVLRHCDPVFQAQLATRAGIKLLRTLGGMIVTRANRGAR